MRPLRNFPEIRTVDGCIAFHAAQRPEQPALLCVDRSIDYRTLDRESGRLARAMQDGGLGRGDRVAYLGKESELYYELFFACAKSGVVLVPINWRLAASEVDHILRDSTTRWVFVEREFAGVVEAMRSELRLIERVVPLDDGRFDEWAAGFARDADEFAKADENDPIVQIYTSGTTGLPKGVVLAHRSFFAVRDTLAAAGLDWIDWREGDVSLISVPGFHVGGIWWAMQAFNAGVVSVSLRMFTSSDAVAAIRRHRVTVTSVVPAMLMMMLSEHGVGVDDFESMRKVVYGGSPISETLLERGLAVMRCEFAQIYGLTETGNAACCLPPADHVPGGPRMRAAGRPFPGFAAKIVGDDGAPLPAGEIGEVCILTPARMIEYWHLPEATARTLVDGLIHTGDAGFVDDDGFVTICDRIKDMIIVAGENVYPAEIENVLSAHPAVAECAVIGVPDERWGEAVLAFVVPKPGESPGSRELARWMKGRIADFKIPTRVEFIERVPRNPSGKILRRELRVGHWQGMARQVN